MRNLTQSSILVGLTPLLFLVACGGGGGGTSSNNGEQPGGSGGGTTIPTLVARASIEPPAGSTIVKTALSPDGAKIAILFDNQTQIPLSDIFGGKYSLQVFDSLSGESSRTMSDPGEGGALLDLYWGEDSLNLLLFDGGWVSWDATSGNVLDVVAANSAEGCNFLSPIESFNAPQNLLYAAQAGNATGVCLLDFNAGTAMASPLEKPDPEASISAMALDATNNQLWISFQVNGFTAAGTQAYNASSMVPVGNITDPALGDILAVGSGYELYNDDGNFTLQPAGVVLAGLDNDATISANASVMALHDEGDLRFIALPEALYIGEVPQDVDRNRSMSTNGAVAGLVYEDRVDIHELPTASTVSAVELPESFARQFSGTLTIDGVAEQISGTCDTDVVAGVEPNIVNLESTLSTGALLTVRAQNLLAFINYRFESAGVVYQHSTTIAQNYSLANPEISTDGISITGSSLLYKFDGSGLFELEMDASDPTGFLTRSLVLDGVCS